MNEENLRAGGKWSGLRSALNLDLTPCRQPTDAFLCHAEQSL